VSHDELIARLEAKGFYDKTEVIKESLGNLEDLRYVELEKTESGNKGRYTLLKSSTGMVEIDWAAALQSADKYMTRKFPTIRDKWYMTCEAQLEQCAGLVHHTQGSEGSVAILDPSHALDEVTQNGT
jgi:hypothetical protein